jgi:DNA polymerase-1
MKLIQDEKPDYIGVAIDLEGPTVRHQKYESYKATRKPMPEELVQQLPYIRRVCEAFRVPVIGHEGYEADDVIGTLARKAAAQGAMDLAKKKGLQSSWQRPIRSASPTSRRS